MWMKRSKRPVNRRLRRRPASSVQQPAVPMPSRRARTSIAARLQAYWTIHLRTARETAVRLIRLRHVSLLTALVIGLTLALPTGLYVLADNVQKLIPDWRADTQVSVFFKLQTPLTQVEARLQEWSGRVDVLRAELIAPDEGLAQLRGLPGFEAAIQALEENPLPAVVILWPQLEAGQDLQQLVEAVQQVAEVDRVQLDREWLERLQAVGILVERLARLMGFLFGLAVLMVVGNTIRMEVQNRRSEIEITKLVGGTDRFIQRPFLYAGIGYGLSGALVAWIIVQMSVWIMSGPVRRLATLYQSDARLHGLGIAQVGLLILIGMVLGGDVNFIAIIDRFFETADPLAQRATDFRKFAGTKNNQNQHQNNYQLRATQAKHNYLQLLLQ